MPTRYTIENMQEHAAFHGGKCLSKEYWDISTKYKWVCAEGHVWEASFQIVKQGAWCPACFKEQEKQEKQKEEREKRIEILRLYAAKRGGICLSKEYINAKTKLEWQCGQGHIWKSTPAIARKNCWCRICSCKANGEKQKHDIEIYRKIALEKGGKLLSDKYIDNHKPLLWECKQGHQWMARPLGILVQKHWCPYCAGSMRKSIKDMQELAARRGGKCLSEEYINTITKLEWQCSKGHIWKTKPEKIQRNRWCPICGLETIKEKQKRDDIEIYRKIAGERGGKLLSDNYINSSTKLLWECKNGHQWEARPCDVKHRKSWCPYCTGRHKTIKDMQELAAKRGGKCLSKEYINDRTKLEWQCSEGHIWKAIPNTIINNHWCRTCGYETVRKKLKYDIENLRKIAIERGGKLLSEDYTNGKTHLWWECQYGHQWKATANAVKNRKTWCPHCKRIAQKGNYFFKLKK